MISLITMPKNIDYPLASFEKAMILASAADELGGSAAIETVAEKLERKISGGFMVIVSSAQKFGLINYEKSIITISEEFKLIKHAYSEAERLNFKQTSFLKPPVFRTLFDRFQNKELPIPLLDKILIREFDVEERTASRVAGYFADGLKELGLMAGNAIKGNMVKGNELTVDHVKLPEDDASQPAEKAVIKKDMIKEASGSGYTLEVTGVDLHLKIKILNTDDLALAEAIFKKIKTDVK